MTTNPPDAPVGPDPAPDGPRVTHDELRDIARLRRSRSDRKIAGVAGGLARHFDIDPIIPRVVLVVLAFFGGAGLLLYVVCWLIVPQEDTEQSTVRLDDRSRTVALAIVAVLAALALLGDSLGGWGFPWPLALVGVVVLVVMLARDRQPRVHPLLREEVGVPPAATYAGKPALPAPPAPNPRRRGPVLFWYALALVALALGVLGIVDLAGASVADSAYPALALGICAAVLLVGAFWGRAGGVVLLGLVATLGTAATTAADEVDAGHIDATPTSASAVDDRYDLTFGEIRLDLSDVTDVEALDGRTVELEVEVGGRIEVVVPDDVDVTVVSRVDLGERRILGDRLGDDGTDTATADGGPDAPRLRIDARLAFGEIVVHHEGSTR